ncbi:MAG: polysaccharide biosynthesis/export family protein [Magnetococcales bacterium]|nr:polysaccharide biosynthesis/export family protein [Magnetococcales bacterium]
MKRALLLIALSAAILSLGPAQADPPPQVRGDDDIRDQYRLGAGDKIAILVNDEPDLSMETKVRPNGKISYSFLGEMDVTGLTIRQVEKLLASRLADGYLRNPVVNISIQSYRMYYINGEVAQAGGFPFQPGLTVRKAVTLAGGFTERAAENKIVVIRGGDPQHREKPIGLDDPIFPDDILTVPEGFW